MTNSAEGKRSNVGDEVFCDAANDSSDDPIGRVGADMNSADLHVQASAASFARTIACIIAAGRILRPAY